MIYTIENKRLRIQVNSHGAELWSFIDKKSGTEHLWQGDDAYWSKRAPVLFPWCGRLKDKRYILDNRTYEYDIHGFASQFEHIVTKQNDDCITFTFSDNEETMSAYPYHFRLYTVFKVSGNQLTQTLKVENANDGDMYFSIGFHTGYKLPFDNEHTIKDYNIVFDRVETPREILCNNAGLLSGEEKFYFKSQRTILLHHELFTNGSFILTDLKSDYVSVVEKDTGKAICVGIKDFPYTVFWSTPNEMKFLCIEPWYGLPDMHNTDGDFKKKPGILKLTSGDAFSCQQTIEIK